MLSIISAEVGTGVTLPLECNVLPFLSLDEFSFTIPSTLSTTSFDNELVSLCVVVYVSVFVTFSVLLVHSTVLSFNVWLRGGVGVLVEFKGPCGAVLRLLLVPVVGLELWRDTSAG